LKATRSGLDASLQSVGEREVAFYRRAAPLMPGGPFPRCYDAEFPAGRFHLLLEDLSDTHMILTEWPLPPSVDACERIVDTWSAFHAFWWRHPSLGREVGTFLDEAALAARRPRAQRAARRALPDRLRPVRRPARPVYRRRPRLAALPDGRGRSRDVRASPRPAGAARDQIRAQSRDPGPRRPEQDGAAAVGRLGIDAGRARR